MAAETKYKFISGKFGSMNQELAKNPGWKPILISSAFNPSGGHEVCVVLEYVPPIDSNEPGFPPNAKRKITLED